MKLYDFDFGGGSGEDGLYPELSAVGAVFFGGEYLSEDIFGVVQFLIFFVFVIGVVFGGPAEQHGS